ncbi:MAG: hypothetical protein QOK23_189 [Gammaproteobacteria bacterium]|jgi:hypothetical protein|nr:hypothetical protein [Gammaproteobacteria bacterium]
MNERLSVLERMKYSVTLCLSLGSGEINPTA